MNSKIVSMLLPTTLAGAINGSWNPFCPRHQSPLARAGRIEANSFGQM